MVTSRERPRHGHKWDANDYQILVAGCVAGLPDHEIALGLGRTETAMKERAEFLVDVAPHRRGNAWEILRMILRNDPDHDWEAVARRRHLERDLPYWDQRADELLDQAWAAAAPGPRWRRGRRAGGPRMQDLEDTLGLHECEIADRLRYRNLARSRPEVVERLGASADGYLAAQSRLITDRDGASLHTLIVTDDSGAVLHASLHPTSAAALAHKDKIAGEFATQPMASWTVLCRALGYGEVSSDTTPLAGSFTPPATAAGERDRVRPDDGRQRSAPFRTPVPVDLDEGVGGADREPVRRKKIPGQHRTDPPKVSWK
ncbi:hypothetical protein AB0H58_32540 [Nocardia neocaledoniensis]|uniref:hypothetical protein n=1 Tax=Nocardia neocaledoniensis TaxID=236511 RepID=UPI0034078ED3